MKLRNLILSPLVLLTLGSASVVYSPISCGCITEGDDFLQHFKISRSALGDPKEPNIEMVRKTISRQLSRKKISLDTLPGVTSCSKLSTTLYRCTYWLWRAPGRERGIEITLALSGAGIYQSASVKPSLRVADPALPGETEDTET